MAGTNFMPHLIPPATTFTEEKTAPHTSVFTIEPLFPGYGRTVGNALRRVLLSSLAGTAVVGVKIDGVEHEFSTLPYVKEDIVDLLLNLKQIHIKSEEIISPEQPITLSLKADGARHVTAGDFEKRSGVTITNPKHHIATLTDDAARLHMTVTLAQGIGYDPIESRKDEQREIGMIALDAIYTPVSAVGYQVENVRVGQMTNWDRVLLTVTTNGVVAPREALSSATGILVDQFEALRQFIVADNEKFSVADPGDAPADEEREEEPQKAVGAESADAEAYESSRIESEEGTGEEEKE